MKFQLLTTMAGALTAIFTAGSVHATTFNYSYTFSDGFIVSGSLDGTLDQTGDLVENVDNVTVFFGRVSIGDTVITAHSDGYYWVLGDPVVSVDGQLNNFYFANNTSTTPNYLCNVVIPSHSEAYASYGGESHQDIADSPNWTLTAVPESFTFTVVPLLALLIGLYGVRSLRVHKSAQNF